MQYLGSLVGSFENIAWLNMVLSNAHASFLSFVSRTVAGEELIEWYDRRGPAQHYTGLVVSSLLH